MSTQQLAATGATGGANGAGGAASNGNDDDFSTDQVKVFSHEGDGENTEHLNSMDLHDIKADLTTIDAEKETKTATNGSPNGQPSIATTSAGMAQASIRPILPHTMVYTNGTGVPFMVPPFAAGTPIYPVMRPVKMEGSDWKAQGGGQIGIPAYSYAAAGFLPVDQATGLRPATAAYPFMIPGQYVAAPYQHQFNTAFGQPVAPNAAVQPNSGIVTPQVKEKKPHIKKPLNAFMLFMKEKRAEVIKECTLKESAAINQILGKKWHALDRSEQAKYYEMAREERQRHMQMYPGWSARDNYAIHKRRKKRKVKQPSSNESSPTKQSTVSMATSGGTTTTSSSSVSGGGESEMCALEEELGAAAGEKGDSDPNAARKCRARYGLEKQNMWCGPCRRKKKCIRYSEDDEDGAPKGYHGDLDDDVITKSSLVSPTFGGGVSETLSTITETKTTIQANHVTTSPTNNQSEQRLITAPITLQTIPT